jgi:hypothetical protein
LGKLSHCLQDLQLSQGRKYQNEAKASALQTTLLGSS